MSVLPLTTNVLDQLGEQIPLHESLQEESLQTVLNEAFANNPEERERVSDILDAVLESPEGTPVLLRTANGVVLGYTSHALYDSPIVVERDNAGYTLYIFTLCLERGLVCPYDKQDPVFELDENDTYFEVQFAGVDEMYRPVTPDVWVGGEAIVRSPALDFEPDMVAVFRHMGIYTK